MNDAKEADILFQKAKARWQSDWQLSIEDQQIVIEAIAAAAKIGGKNDPDNDELRT